MRLITLMAKGVQIRRIFYRFGVDPEPPYRSPAHGPPLWEDGDTQIKRGAQIEPNGATDWDDWDGAVQPAPDYEMD